MKLIIVHEAEKESERTFIRDLVLCRLDPEVQEYLDSHSFVLDETQADMCVRGIVSIHKSAHLFERAVVVKLSEVSVEFERPSGDVAPSERAEVHLLITHEVEHAYPILRTPTSGPADICNVCICTDELQLRRYIEDVKTLVMTRTTLEERLCGVVMTFQDTDDEVREYVSVIDLYRVHLFKS